MSNFLSGFKLELTKLASAGESVVPLVLHKNPDPSELKKALREVKRDTSRDSAWKRITSGASAPVRRNYLASMLIGAAAAPAALLVGKSLSRAIRNKTVMREVGKATDEAKKLELLGKVERGPLIGHFHPDTPPHLRPTMDTSEVGGRMAAGAMTGSIIQGIRDHFSGGHH